MSSSLAERSCQDMDDQGSASSAWRRQMFNTKIFLRRQSLSQNWDYDIASAVSSSEGGPRFSSENHLDSFWIVLQFSIGLTPKCVHISKIIQLSALILRSNNWLSCTWISCKDFRESVFWSLILVVQYQFQKAGLFLMQTVISKNMLQPNKICN